MRPGSISRACPPSRGCQSSPAISRRPNTTYAARPDASRVPRCWTRHGRRGDHRSRHRRPIRDRKRRRVVCVIGSDSNVNLQRVGRAFHIAALDTPEYDNRLNSTFDVQGSGRTFDQTKLDATGTLTDSEAWGARFPRLGYETHLDAGTLDARAKGRFEQLDPSRVTGSAVLKGLVTGTADVHTRIADVGSPITLDAFAVDGTVSLEHSTLGDLQVESAEVDGKYASRGRGPVEAHAHRPGRQGARRQDGLRWTPRPPRT